MSIASELRYRSVMHYNLTAVLALFVASTLFAATTPADAWRALQQAAEGRDAEAMAAVLAPEERDALRNEVQLVGVDNVAKRVPKGALKITSESADIVAGEADRRQVLFVRDGANWYVAAIFAKPKKQVGVVQPEPSVRVDKKHVLSIAPIRGAGMPTESAISAAKAYELLLAEARSIRPGARLYALQTGLHALSSEGASSSWAAELLTDTPGELLTLVYDDGDVEAPLVGSIRPDRQGVPDPDAVGYDTKKLYEEALQHASGVVDPVTRVTASLYRSAGSGKALWLLSVYGDDDRIGQTVVFDAKTMKFSHKTK